jgi:hypothetical protein
MLSVDDFFSWHCIQQKYDALLAFDETADPDRERRHLFRVNRNFEKHLRRWFFSARTVDSDRSAHFESANSNDLTCLRIGTTALNVHPKIGHSSETTPAASDGFGKLCR